MYQYAVFGPATLYPVLAPIAINMDNQNKTPEVIAEDAKNAKTWNEVLAPYLERELGDNKYLGGDQFGAADLMICYDLGAAQFVGLLQENTKINDYVRRLAERESWKRVFA